MKLDEIKASLKQLLRDPSLTLQVSQTTDQIVVVINRADSTVEANYSEIAEKMLAQLLSFQLPEIRGVKFYGRQAGANKPEWQETRSLVPEKPKSKPTVTVAKKMNQTEPVLSKAQGVFKKFSPFEMVSSLALLGILSLLLANTVFGQKPKAVVWEYKVESVPDLIFTESMNRLGDEGWELVTARRAQDSMTEDFSYECIFKRQKQ